MLRFENVAMPFAALAVSVPASVPLDGFVPMAMATALVAVVTGLPEASSIVPCTVIAAPAATFVGCTLNTSFAAAPATTLNALLVAVPPGVVTLRGPVVAPAGTVA